MEAVLHIEPIMRHTNAPICIGHTKSVYFGDGYTLDGELIDEDAKVTLGCPLASMDFGNTATHVPLVKSIECMPDYSRKKGHVYLETIHYLKDRRFLIPIRTKLRSGLGSSLRLTHLPSLNLARSSVTGLYSDVCDARGDVIDSFIKNNAFELSHRNPPLFDWLTHDLTVGMSWEPTNKFSFSSTDYTDMVHRLDNAIHRTPNDLTPQNLKSLVNIVTPELEMSPNDYSSRDSICRHLLDFKNRTIPNNVNFQSFGPIGISNINNVEYNPIYLQDICDLLDRIPLTDFNVDFVIDHDYEIRFYHEHVSLNRFGQFEDADIGAYQAETILKHYLTENVLKGLISKIVDHHEHLTDETLEIFNHQPLKIKMIKTITDEAAILIYPYNSDGNSRPLCGVYFDIALQSLAPMSIVPEPLLM